MTEDNEALRNQTVKDVCVLSKNQHKKNPYPEKDRGNSLL